MAFSVTDSSCGDMLSPRLKFKKFQLTFLSTYIQYLTSFLVSFERLRLDLAVWAKKLVNHWILSVVLVPQTQN